jgi:hypothetical protein
MPRIVIFILVASEPAHNGCGLLPKQVARPSLSLNYAVETDSESISRHTLVVMDLFRVCTEM